MMMGEIYVNVRQVYILSMLKIHPHYQVKAHDPPQCSFPKALTGVALEEPFPVEDPASDG